MTPKKDLRFFPREEFKARHERVCAAMAERGLDACLISSPENIYYLCGLSHQGYFAYQLLIVPCEGPPILVTRAMERAIVRDLVPDAIHVGYADGVEPLPAPGDRTQDLVMSSPQESGRVAGLEPWSTSLGVAVRGNGGDSKYADDPVRATCRALENAGLAEARLGIEKASCFLPYRIAEGIVREMHRVKWEDCSGLVDDVRVVQSPLELKCTRKAARLSDAMMLAAIAAAGPGIDKSDIMAAVYQTMFTRGGTYPGFVPLVRSTRTLEHEHGTWDPTKLGRKDILFLELAGCVRRYHAPTGRLVYVGKLPKKAEAALRVCREAMERVVDTIGPGVPARDVYRAWQARVDEAGLEHYRRHHCGYSIGIGFPPSWSGSGTPVGLRENSKLKLEPGMVFHLMSWLLRTAKGDAFLSDTAVVTEKGCEVLTKVPHDLIVR